jgi:hypothetical protein
MYNSTRINRHVTRPVRISCALRSVAIVAGKDLTYRIAWTSPFPLRQYEPAPDPRNSNVIVIDRDIIIRFDYRDELREQSPEHANEICLSLGRRCYNVMLRNF